MAQRQDVERGGLRVADWGRWSATARGRIAAGWLSELRRDPLLRRARVVVDLVIGRRRILLATVPLQSRSLDGGLRPYAQDLKEEPELVNVIEPSIPDAQGRSVSVSFRGEAAQLRELLSSGWPIAGQGEVSLLVDGMEWEDRIVYLRGPLSGGIAFGTEDEAVDVTISDPQIVSAMIPPWTISTQRFPVAPDQSIGEPIPIVVTSMVATPCPRTKLSTGGGVANQFLAGHGVITVGSVWVDGVLTVPSATPATTDARGLPITLIEFPNGTTDDTSSVHATLTSATDLETSLIPALRKVLETVGGITSERLSERLFSESAARLADVGASPTARTSPRIVLNSAGRVLEVISDLLLDWPMISMAWDGAGIGPVVIDHRAEPVARLTLGQYPILNRAKGVRYETTPTTELRTSFQLRYSYNAMRDAWGGMAVRNPDNSDLCQMALEMTEIEQAEPMLEAYSIGDSASANLVLDWLCEHRARPSLSVILEGYPEAWLLLREGDTVAWTDPDVGLSEAPSIVVSRKWAKGGEGTRVEIGLRIYPGLAGQIGGSDQ